MLIVKFCLFFLIYAMKYSIRNPTFTAIIFKMLSSTLLLKSEYRLQCPTFTENMKAEASYNLLSEKKVYIQPTPNTYHKFYRLTY